VPTAATADAAPRWPLWIGGEPVPAADGASFASYDPATGERIAEVARAGVADVQRAVAAARRAFDEGPWPRTSPAERAAVLRRVADRITAEADRLAVLESRDTGGTIRKAGRVDVPGAAAAFDRAAWSAEALGDREPPAPPRPGGYLHWQPYGVVAGITPWNFPLLLAAGKAAAALAAGNCVVLKPASFTSLSTLELGRIATECGLPPGVLTVLTGPGPVVGEQLARHPGIDLVSLTGSDDVGSRVRGLDPAAEVRLELGGKSATLVLDDADLDLAASGALWAVFFHNGQVCMAGSRLVVADRVHDELVGLMVERAGRLRLGPPLDPATDLGPLVARQHARGVLARIRAAVAGGARLLCGGAGADPAELGPGLDAAAYVRPTVLAGVAPDSPAAQEEVFGPVLTVLRVGSEQEAVAVANGTRYGLSAAVWSRDPARAARVAERLRADRVWVNDNRMIELTRPEGPAAGADRHWHRLTNELDHYRRRQHIDVDGDAGRRQRPHYDLLSSRI
jgi:aldehyde dehydrogenase (NAD+)